MSRATSLTVIAVGAIFAFAITASPSFLRLQVVGWILMATGAAGLLLQRRSRDWLRRSVIVRDRVRRPRQPRRRQQLEQPAGYAEPRADPDLTHPLEQPLDQPAERETIEEYIEHG